MLVPSPASGPGGVSTRDYPTFVFSSVEWGHYSTYLPGLLGGFSTREFSSEPGTHEVLSDC